MTALLLRAVTTLVPIQVDIADNRPETRALREGQTRTEDRDLRFDIGPVRAGLKAGTFYCEGLPGWACKRLRSRLAIEPKETALQLTQFRDRFVGNIGGAMFVLMPAFALWLKHVYLNRRMRYTEHLVFALHVHAFWFLALVLMLPDWGWLSTAAFVVVPTYTLFAMRRVYRGRVLPLLLRAALVTALYGPTLGVALAGVAIWSLLF